VGPASKENLVEDEELHQPEDAVRGEVAITKMPARVVLEAIDRAS